MRATTIIRNISLPLAGACALFLLAPRAHAIDEGKAPEKRAWSWEGPTGHYDRAALQRGFQVFNEVCKDCHTLHYVPFRMLGDPGGPGFSEAEVKAIAAAYEKDVIDQFGDAKQVPRTPADTLPNPYPNEQFARSANSGALPPDLSVIIKARKGGPNYVHSLLTGFGEPPPGVELRTGLNYNPYFTSGQIAMAPPLPPDRVTYADGTPATTDQMASDVVTFLAWASEPKLEQRKRLGLNVMAYLVVLAGLLFWSYRRVWRDQH